MSTETKKTGFSREAIEQSVRYLTSPRVFLTADEVDRIIASQIPASWLALLAPSTDVSAGIQRLWAPVCGDLPSLLQQFERRLNSVALLLEDDRPPSLLYLYGSEGNIYHHRGFPPLSATAMPGVLGLLWTRLPEAVRQLYAIHNGWVFTPAESMGHLPVDKVFLLSMLDWSVPGHELEQLPFSLDETLALFANGAGDYLCLHLPEQSPPTGLVWWSDTPTEPELNVDFMSVYDVWLTLHFEGMDSLGR